MVKRERVLSYGRMTAKNYQLLFNVKQLLSLQWRKLADTMFIEC